MSGSPPNLAPQPSMRTRPASNFDHPAYVSPTSIEMANLRFNETAPPVVSPSSSSPRSAGALPRSNPTLNRGQQIPYSVMNDVDETQYYVSHNNSTLKRPGTSSTHHDDPQRPDVPVGQGNAKKRKQRKHSSSRYSSPSTHSRRATHAGRTEREKREKQQQQHRRRERMRRPYAAMPKFGRPFASNPELPSLTSASASPAASSATLANLNLDRLANAKVSTSKEAAVPGLAVPFSKSNNNNNVVNSSGGFGGLQGGPSAGPDRLAQHSSVHYDSNLIIGPNSGNGTGTNMPFSIAAYANSKNSVPASPVKNTSMLLQQQQQQKVVASSGTVDNEGALFQTFQNRRVAYPGREEANGSSGYSPPSCSSRGGNGNHHGGRRGGGSRNGDTTHRPRHHHNHNNEEEEMGNRSGSAYTSSDESNASRATLVTRDSFGYPIYHPLFRQGSLGDYHDLDLGRSGGGGRASFAGRAGGGGGPAAPTLEVPTTTDVPWDLRNIAEKEIYKTFAFLSNRYFWFLIEYALRVTCIAMLVPAIIINLDIKNTPFVSTTFALTSVVIAVGTNFGQSCVFFVQYVKGGCIWLPLATICSALKLNRYLAAWFVVYVVLLFLMAMFTEKTTRRMCLLLFNISMVSLLSGDESLVFPTRVLADWALGAAFALIATLIPYPLLATRFSARITKTIFNNTATCFTGILSCFWAPSNTERSMSMVRIRSLVRTLDHLIEKFDSYDAFTFYEVLIYETSERREVRKEKVKLLLKLKMNLRAMERVINMVQEKPQMIDQSERCLLLRDHLSVAMDDISRSMEALLWKLSGAKKYDQLRTLSGYFEATGRAMKRLQTEFDLGRRVLFYEHQEAGAMRDGRMEEFVPLMTFFVFSIVNFWTTLEEFETFIDLHKPTNDWKESFKLVWNALIDPFIENAQLVRLLCVRRSEPELRVVIEAAKVSVSMLVSVIFFYYVDNQSLLLTGPSIIAFVSGTNPVEAVQAGAARMSGTLIGAVLGFFAASLCHTAVDRVASLCVITFVMTFFRPGQKFGTICMYCNFVAVSSLAPTEQTADITISRIQQNTFAIFIYCFISVAVFPVSPNHVLFRKRISVVSSMNSIMQKLSSLFNDAALSYIETRNEILRGVKTEDDVISISHLEGGPDAMRISGSPLLMVGRANNANVNNSSTIINVKGFNNNNNNNNSPEPGAGPASRRTSNIIIPGAFTMAPKDTAVEKIFTDIFAVMDTMKATTSVMPLAADEFQIIPREYPLRASGDVHAALYRLCALIYTMACAWKTMRDKGYFTTDMLHILHNLAPITNDIARCIDRFTHVLDFYVRFPSSGLSSELTKGVMQFRALCVELSARKERDLIAVIRHTILMKRIRNDDSVVDDDEKDEAAQRDKNGLSIGTSDNNNNNNNNGGAGWDIGGGGHNLQKPRSSFEESGSRSSKKHRRRRRGHQPGRRRSSRPNHNHHDNGHHRGASSGNGRHQRRRSSLNHNHHKNSHNIISDLNERTHSRGNDPLNASSSAPAPVRSAAAAFGNTATAGEQRSPAQAGESCSSESTFKDSVMPRVDSREQVSPHFTPPIPGDSSWLPVPRSELPEMPAQPPQHQGRDSSLYQHKREAVGDEDSITADLSPRSRVDGNGTVTNATRVFDPSVFPPPPLDEEQAAAVRRARLEAQLPPSMQGDSISEHLTVLREAASAPTTLADKDAAPLQMRGDDETVAELSRSQLHYPHAAASLAPPASSGASETTRHAHSAHISPHMHQHHQQHHHSPQQPQHRSSRIPQQQAAHEESLPIKKSSALIHADRLRENLRGFQRQSPHSDLTRRRSSYEMHTFGASYTSTAGLGKPATTASHNPAHHRSSHTHHHSHHLSPHPRAHGHSHSSLYYEEEEEDERGAEGDAPHRGGHLRRSHTADSGRGLGSSSVPYGSQEGDLAFMAAPNQHEETHEPASLSFSDPHLADENHRVSGQQHGRASLTKEAASLPQLLSISKGANGGTNYPSQDRITLDHSSSKEDEDYRGNSDEYSSASSDSLSPSYSSSSSSSSGSSSYGNDRSDRSECGSSDRDNDSDFDESSSLVRFNDSFTTPITVQDAEGLHAFTLSLEMFAKELRRVLYGLEEMIQSL